MIKRTNGSEKSRRASVLGQKLRESALREDEEIEIEADATEAADTAEDADERIGSKIAGLVEAAVAEGELLDEDIERIQMALADGSAEADEESEEVDEEEEFEESLDESEEIDEDEDEDVAEDDEADEDSEEESDEEEKLDEAAKIRAKRIAEAKARIARAKKIAEAKRRVAARKRIAEAKAKVAARRMAEEKRASKRIAR